MTKKQEKLRAKYILLEREYNALYEKFTEAGKAVLAAEYAMIMAGIPQEIISAACTLARQMPPDAQEAPGEGFKMGRKIYS